MSSVALASRASRNLPIRQSPFLVKRNHRLAAGVKLITEEKHVIQALITARIPHGTAGDLIQRGHKCEGKNASRNESRTQTQRGSTEKERARLVLPK